MKKGIIICIFFIFMGIIHFRTETLWAQEKAFWDSKKNLYATIGPQFGYINGDTTYHIGFPGGASELEFPIDNALWGFEASLGYRNPYNDKQDRARLVLKFFSDIDNYAGKMKDFDWLDDDGHSGLDIYSESDADLDAVIIDLYYIFNFSHSKTIGIGPMIGYRYQSFEYEISNTDQVGFGPYSQSYTTAIPGRTLDYEVKYNIFYLGLNTDVIVKGNFKLNLRWGAGWVNAKDEDDHILRYKLSKGDSDGAVYLVNINANWEFLHNWILQLSGEYVDIDTDGTQHQEFYSPSIYTGWEADVDDKITSSLWMAYVTLKYRF